MPPLVRCTSSGAHRPHGWRTGVRGHTQSWPAHGFGRGAQGVARRAWHTGRHTSRHPGARRSDMAHELQLLCHVRSPCTNAATCVPTPPRADAAECRRRRVATPPSAAKCRQVPTPPSADAAEWHSSARSPGSSRVRSRSVCGASAGAVDEVVVTEPPVLTSQSSDPDHTSGAPGAHPGAPAEPTAAGHRNKPQFDSLCDSVEFGDTTPPRTGTGDARPARRSHRGDTPGGPC